MVIVNFGTLKVPKTAPELRQSYAGLTLNHATNVVVRDNMVKTELHNDYAYMACCGATIVGDSRDNKVRNEDFNSVNINLCNHFTRTVRFPKKKELDMGRLNHIFTHLSRQQVGQNAWKRKI